MGSSKIILVSGLCVMLGFYAYVIQKATQSIVASGSDRRAVTQARLISQAALNVTCYYLSNPTSLGGQLTKSGKEFSGGTMSWSIDTTRYSVGEASVVTKGFFGADTVIQYGKLKVVSTGIGKKRWGVAALYTTPQRMHEEVFIENTRF
jgi:hypothetical protein